MPTGVPAMQGSIYFGKSKLSVNLFNVNNFNDDCDLLGQIVLINLLADFSLSTI